jgi:ABC-2 type transport system permease protein
VTGAAFTAGNRLSRAFDGPASGTELGAMAMVETYAVLAVLAGLMSLLIVTRLTRQDEETGRAELVGSAAVGRRARLLAALVVAPAPTSRWPWSPP